MTFDHQILQILSEVGHKGISVRLLAKHVYNLNCTLFASPDFDEIHRYVQQFLSKNSKSAQSLIESTGEWGRYRLNTQNSADARQLLFEFTEAQEKKDGEEENEEQRHTQDHSLSLFD